MDQEQALTAPLDIAAFRQRFDGIQLRLHYERIPPGAGRVKVREISDPAELGELFTAYRATERQVEARMANPWARPMRIRDIAARMSEFPSANQDAFRAYGDRFARSSSPTRVEAPAYGLDGDGLLLLDGNHRATALLIAGRPFVLRLAVLQAPVNRRILIDLKYWDGGWRRWLSKSR